MRALSHLIDLAQRRTGMQATLSSGRIRSMASQMGPSERELWCVRLLASSPNDAAWVDFVEELFVHETYFFRHPTQLRFLADEVIPDLLAQCDGQGRRRLLVWCAGCSSGEEVYTMGLLLNSIPAFRNGNWGVNIVGTDLSARILEQARQGGYEVPPGMNSFRDIPDYAAIHFTGVVGGGETKWMADAALRSGARFQCHNLIKDPPPVEDADLVLCRNTLIYFGDADTAAALTTLTRALRPGGVLALGPSDGLHTPPGCAMIEAPRSVVWRKEREALS